MILKGESAEEFNRKADENYEKFKARQKQNLIDMMKVVIIPTDKASCIHRNKVKTDSGYEYRLTYHETPSKCKNDGLLSGNQHLYITSDDEIKEGDWWINFDTNTIHNGNLFELANRAPSCKKIIATTDPELNVIYTNEEPPTNPVAHFNYNVPQIPQSLIESYCKNPVDKVLVEYESINLTGDFTPNKILPSGSWVFRPKLTSNNEIIIELGLYTPKKLYTIEDIKRCVENWGLCKVEREYIEKFLETNQNKEDESK
ncbi:hypothetical protein OAA15_00430 [bacterium]|nr:hypothetical protein [bacterium]